MCLMGNKIHLISRRDFEINLAQFIKNRRIIPPLPLHHMCDALTGAFYDPTLDKVVTGEKLVLEMLSLGLVDNKIPEFWKVAAQDKRASLSI